MLVLRDVRSGYGGSEVVQGLSLTCNQGKITAIIGPNGAGKTTLLKTILKLIELTSGQILLNEEDITSLSTPEVIHRGIAYVPQGANVFPQMTVKENLMMGGHTMKDGKEVMKQIDNVVQLFPVLKERLHQRSGYMSGGERRMLAIARALISNPKLLLLDEPSVGLDMGKSDVLFDKLVELNKKGLTVLITEQNFKRVLEIAHYAYALNGGRVRYEGTSQELLGLDAEKILFGVG